MAALVLVVALAGCSDAATSGAESPTDVASTTGAPEPTSEPVTTPSDPGTTTDLPTSAATEPEPQDGLTTVPDAEFCGAFEQLSQGLDDIGRRDYAALAEAVNDLARQLRGVGVPDGFSAGARVGFAAYTDFLAGVTRAQARDLATERDPSGPFRGRERLDVQAFFTEFAQTCLATGPS